MSNSDVALWRAPPTLTVSDTTTNVPSIVGAAKQLRERERAQIASNLDAGNYEVATTFVWLKSMALLKKQIEGLGNQFVSELLQRFDIDEDTDLKTAISDSEALSLARDLGIVNATQAMRLSHSQQVISHFASLDASEMDDDAGMTPEDAVACLRVCVQGILGQDSVGVAEDFASFRTKLAGETFTPDSPEIIRLQQSPYFFVRTAISVLLSTIKTGKGAQLEHAARNANVIVPLFWSGLKQPEKWQIGQSYASEFAEGRRDSVRALHNVLVAVKGFDFVPENLRSHTFTRVANSVIAAHQGSNNFYNEPGPMRELASLGSSIPGPAFPTCMTAVLCVKLGNMYGVSWAAQSAADQVISSLSAERWVYYLDGRLEFDRVILPKFSYEACIQRWISLISASGIEVDDIKTRSVQNLIKASLKGDKAKVAELGQKLHRNSYS